MKIKRLLSLALAIVLVLSCVPMGADAATPKYTVSSSYKSSSYYTALCNVTLTGNQREDIVNVALSQVGYREGSSSNDFGGADDGSYNNYTEYNYWYHNYVSSGMPIGGDDAPWCATFVSWCAEQANIPSSILKRSTAAGHGYSYFNINFYSGSSTLASSSDNDSFFKGYNYTPQKGDLFFTRSWSHVGLVVEVNGSYVITVEGNTNNNGSSQGNGVYRLTGRRIADLYFGVPNYTTSEHTCDKGAYVYYEAAHPHYKCYRCSVCGEIWRNTQEPTIVSSCSSCVPQKTVDSRYSSYYPIGAFPLSTGHISVYDASGNLYSNRYIDGATDVCLIWEIYTDGWCKVRYPSSAEESGYFDAYVPLSVFTTASSPSTWTATSDYTTYRRSDLSSTMSKVSSGTTGLLLSTNGSVRQIIHPVSGYDYSMMGWISDPKQIHISDDSLSLTLGGTESKVIYAWSTGSYNGNTALYFSKSNSNISCSWGEWTNGKAPLTITANSVGTTTLTIGVRDSDSKEVLDSTTILITVKEKTYSVSYNANGGSGAPSRQTKPHGTDLTLSSTIPTRFGYNFIGWGTSSSATSATYQPGDTYSNNSAMTLYAVWDSPYAVTRNFGSYALVQANLYPGVGIYYRFIPAVSTKYRILGDDTLDTTVILYDASGKQLAADDDSGTGDQFQIDYQFTAGKTYYIYVCFYSNSIKDNLDFKLLKGYNLSYDANGGSGAPNSTHKYYGVNISLSGIIPYRAGYTFLGWSTEPSSQSASYQPGSIFSANADTKLYAVWKQGCSGKHSYNPVITAPTCISQGYTTYTCTACGDRYIDDYTEAKGHSYQGRVIAPTCREQGYTIHSCSHCGDNYKDSYVDLMPHEFQNGICRNCGSVDLNYEKPSQSFGNEIIRLAGDTRFETAFEIANQFKENLGIEKFDSVIVASGTNFADALSGSYLAAVKNAPILLTCNKDFNPRLVEKYNNMLVEYIGANMVPGGTVYILGGEKAVDPSLDAALTGCRVVRLAGATRYETNLEILKEAGVGNREVLICYGEKFPDSLAASATGNPILLVRNKLTEAQKSFLHTTTGKFIIIGGTAVISNDLENSLKNYGSTERLAGSNRYTTCIMVAERFFDRPNAAVVAYGENFPDGLCGGILAHSMDAPLILVREDYLKTATDYTAKNTIYSGVVLGGEKLISEGSVHLIFNLIAED